VRAAFDSALSESLAMQKTIYDKMAARGWYPAEQAEAAQISKVKNKYAAGQQ
jgi:spore coat protein CotF